MFDERHLDGDLAAIRETHAPDTLVFDCMRDFETLDPAVAEELGMRVNALDPTGYDPGWVPDDAPDQLHRLAAGEFTVGAPGDGGVAWTRQTVPPCVFVKPRLAGSPDAFVDFLVAEALVEIGLDIPETFLGFFEADYRALATATPLGPADTYQLAVALFDAWVGLQSRETFTEWGADYPALHTAWVDAGDRLEPRLSGLSAEVARGETEFAAAAELACNAMKHDLELPVPFSALDTAAYQQHGAAYAVQWAERTFEELS